MPTMHVPELVPARRAARLAFLLLAGHASSVGAQRAGDASELSVQDLRRAVAQIVDPSGRSPLRAELPQVTVKTAVEDQMAKAQLGFVSPIAIIAALSTKLDARDEGRSPLIDLDGLPDRTQGEVTAKFYRWNPVANLAEIRRICANLQLVDPAKDKSCDTANPNIAAWQRDRLRRAFAPGNPLAFAASYKRGTRTKYEFVDASGVEGSEKHAGQSATAALGTYFLKRVTFLSAELSWQESFKSGDAVTVCSPVGGGGATTVARCAARALNAPTREESLIGRFVARRYFGAVFAAEIVASHDFRKSVQGVQLPLYFLRGGDEGLNGGVSLAWQSNGGGIRPAVFVGAVGSPNLR